MRKLSRLSIAAGSAAVVGLAFALVPATAALAAPPCGSTLVASVTLSADLNCAGDAYTIGAPGITIDLAGFRIIGNGTGVAVRDSGQDNLTVAKGTISGFASGLSLSNVSGVSVSDMTIRDGQAIIAKTVSGLKVGSSEFRSTVVLIGQNSPSPVLAGVIFRSTGITLSQANNAQLTGSDLLDTTVNGSESTAVVVQGNVFVRSALGYGVNSTGWRITNNSFVNGTVGLDVGPASPGASIFNNSFVGNNLGIALHTTNMLELNGTSIVRNSFYNNGAAGILFDSTGFTGSPTIKISGNQFFHNGFNPAGRTDRLGRPVADGLHTATTAGSQIVIAGSETFVNATFGISSDPGTVVDGGGNESDGDPSGCSGVFCA
jgi:Periplasmic copper-binding protein (NosD)